MSIHAFLAQTFAEEGDEALKKAMKKAMKPQNLKKAVKKEEDEDFRKQRKAEDDDWVEEEEDKKAWIGYMVDDYLKKQYTSIDLHRRMDEIASKKKRLEWEGEALEKVIDLKEEEEAARNHMEDLEEEVRLVKP